MPLERRFVLRGEMAADLMTSNPISIAETMTVREAAAVLTDRAISAVPVTDDAGRPVGVLTHTDITRFERQRVTMLPENVDRFAHDERRLTSGENLPAGFEIEMVDNTPVSEIMTPAVFSVREIAPIETVLGEFLKHKVHHLFVTDESDVLVGVISTFDLLRLLKPMMLD
jgi:CBS domain-containing protein